MKKTKIFIAAIAILAGTTTLFTACKKKDSSSSSSTTSSSLVGTWKLSNVYKFSVDSTIPPPFVPQVFNTTLTHNETIYYKFYSNNNFKYSDAANLLKGDDTGSYTVLANNKLAINSIVNGSDTVTNFTISNNQLILKFISNNIGNSYDEYKETYTKQ